MCLLPSNYAGNEEEAVIEAINNSLMHDAIVTTRIAIRNTDNTNVGIITRSFILVLYSLGVLSANVYWLLTTWWPGQGLYNAGKLSTRRGLFIRYRSHYITFPPDFLCFLGRAGNLDDVNECNVSWVGFFLVNIIIAYEIDLHIGRYRCITLYLGGLLGL